MKFKCAYHPDGQRTVETKFLLFPCSLQGEVRWLEQVHMLGRWMECRDGVIRFFPERFVEPGYVIPKLTSSARTA